MRVCDVLGHLLHIPKLKVVGSNPITRSPQKGGSSHDEPPFLQPRQCLRVLQKSATPPSFNLLQRPSRRLTASLDAVGGCYGVLAALFDHLEAHFKCAKEKGLLCEVVISPQVIDSLLLEKRRMIAQEVEERCSPSCPTVCSFHHICRCQMCLRCQKRERCVNLEEQ